MDSARNPMAIGHQHSRFHLSVRRVLALVLTLVVVAVWTVFLRPGALAGPATYVIVAGASMEPELHSNDLVIAMRQSTYSVGDVVVYRVPAADLGAGTQIVHRIVGGDPQRGFLVQGDSREGLDHWEPTADEILGKMQLSVPFGGTVLLFLRTPPGIALLAGLTTLLIALGAPARRPAKPRGHPLRVEDDY